MFTSEFTFIGAAVAARISDDYERQTTSYSAMGKR